MGPCGQRERGEREEGEEELFHGSVVGWFGGLWFKVERVKSKVVG